MAAPFKSKRTTAMTTKAAIRSGSTWANKAKLFSDGNFAAPMLVHDQNPPRVDVMKRLKADLKYQFSETERGASIRIITSDADALAAIHEFLSFQIREHQT